MTEVLDYEYEHVCLVKLSDTEYTALSASGIDFSGASYSGGRVSVGGQTVTARDLKGQCLLAVVEEVADNNMVATVDSDVKREFAVQPSVRVNTVWLLDDESDGVWAWCQDTSGHWLFFLEATEGQVFCGVFDIHRNVPRETREDAAGVAKTRTELRNVSRSKPKSG